MISWTWTKTEYPFEHTAAEKWNTVLSASIFLSLISILLQPYGFTPLARSQLFISYLLIAFVILNVNYFGIPYFFPSFFEDGKWSISRAFLFLSYNFLLIGFWIHIINSLMVKNDPVLMASGFQLVITLIRALSIGFIASGLLILIRYNILTKKHLQIAQELNQYLHDQLKVKRSAKRPPQTIEFLLENKSATIQRNQLRYISSEGNYLAFHFKKKKQLFRGRIKNMEQVLKDYPEFFRCHRSFIINLNHVESTFGNSQGLHVKLFHKAERIPVARPKIKQLKQLLEKNQTAS